MNQTMQLSTFKHDKLKMDSALMSPNSLYLFMISMT
jgi:hypothetical protein